MAQIRHSLGFVPGFLTDCRMTLDQGNFGLQRECVTQQNNKAVLIRQIFYRYCGFTGFFPPSLFRQPSSQA